MAVLSLRLGRLLVLSFLLVLSLLFSQYGRPSISQDSNIGDGDCPTVKYLRLLLDFDRKLPCLLILCG